MADTGFQGQKLGANGRRVTIIVTKHGGEWRGQETTPQLRAFCGVVWHTAMKSGRKCGTSAGGSQNGGAFFERRGAEDAEKRRGGKKCGRQGGLTVTEWAVNRVPPLVSL